MSYFPSYLDPTLASAGPSHSHLLPILETLGTVATVPAALTPLPAPRPYDAVSRLMVARGFDEGHGLTLAQRPPSQTDLGGGGAWGAQGGALEMVSAVMIERGYGAGYGLMASGINHRSD